MKYAIQKGSTTRIVDADIIQEKLPLGTYNLCFDGMSREYYLDKVQDLEVPKKIYGDMSIVDRIIKVYRQKDRNVGIMLYGLKGSGKTLCMRKLAIDLHQPVILINENFGDFTTEAIQFLSNKALGDCTILIDEFEKKFNDRDDSPLTLLDGPYPTHHFFVLTANDMHINENLQNRPGRIYYNIGYSGLQDDIIKAVAEDLLCDKSKMEGLMDCCEDLANLSFDMLISIINDMNLFNEDAKTVIKWFGFTKESQYATVYQKLNGKLLSNPVLDSYYLSNSGRGNSQWVDVQLIADDKQSIEDVVLRFNTMTKVRKNVYSIIDYITPSDIREADTKKEKDAAKAKLVNQGVKFEPNSYRVKVEFEVYMSSNAKINYVY